MPNQSFILDIMFSISQMIEDIFQSTLRKCTGKKAFPLMLNTESTSSIQPTFIYIALYFIYFLIKQAQTSQSVFQRFSILPMKALTRGLEEY